MSANRAWQTRAVSGIRLVAILLALGASGIFVEVKSSLARFTLHIVLVEVLIFSTRETFLGTISGKRAIGTVETFRLTAFRLERAFITTVAVCEAATFGVRASFAFHTVAAVLLVARGADTIALMWIRVGTLRALGTFDAANVLGNIVRGARSTCVAVLLGLEGTLRTFATDAVFELVSTGLTVVGQGQGEEKRKENRGVDIHCRVESWMDGLMSVVGSDVDAGFYSGDRGAGSSIGDALSFS